MSRLLKLIFFFGMLVVLGIVVMVVWMAFQPFASAGLNHTSWYVLGMIIFMVVLMLVCFRPFVRRATPNAKKITHLATVGVKTMALVVSVLDTGITMNQDPKVKITVEIKPGIQSTFQVFVSRVQIPRPGDMMEIVYDPADPNCAMLATKIKPTGF